MILVEQIVLVMNGMFVIIIVHSIDFNVVEIEIEVVITDDWIGNEVIHCMMDGITIIELLKELKCVR